MFFNYIRLYKIDILYVYVFIFIMSLDLGLAVIECLARFAFQVIKLETLLSLSGKGILCLAFIYFLKRKNPLFTNSQLRELNQKGIFPGPREDKGQFEKRVSALKEPIYLKESLPFTEKDAVPLANQVGAQRLTQRLFDVAPDWIPAYYHNYRLAPWHGATTWTLQDKKKKVERPLIQLPKSLKEKQKYMKVYQREELFAHEFVHAARSSFEGSVFEEYFAYMTASSPFRRYFGPLIRTSKELYLFFTLLFLPILLFPLFLIYGWGSTSFFILGALPIILIAGGSIRLVNGHRTLKACQNKLKRFVKTERAVRAVALRLTDEEIRFFAKAKLATIRAFIRDQKYASMRWRVITNVYFS